jgi:hypothetical protein
MLIKLAANRAEGAISYYGKRSFDVHPRHIAGLGVACPVGTLVRQADAHDALALNERRGDGHSRPDLHRSGQEHLLANPLEKLTQGEH